MNKYLDEDYILSNYCPDCGCVEGDFHAALCMFMPKEQEINSGIIHRYRKRGLPLDIKWLSENECRCHPKETVDARR